VTTFTQSTLEENLPMYVVEVLRNNISDPSSATRPTKELFIYKDRPAKIADTYPYLIVSLDQYDEDVVAYDVRAPRESYIEVMVVTKGQNALYQRDSYTSLVRSTLSDNSSENSDGVSLEDQHLRFTTFNSTNNDTTTTDGDIVRLKTLRCGFIYEGD